MLKTGDENIAGFFIWYDSHPADVGAGCWLRAAASRALKPKTLRSYVSLRMTK